MLIDKFIVKTVSKHTFVLASWRLFAFLDTQHRNTTYLMPPALQEKGEGQNVPAAPLQSKHRYFWNKVVLVSRSIDDDCYYDVDDTNDMDDIMMMT